MLKKNNKKVFVDKRLFFLSFIIIILALFFIGVTKFITNTNLSSQSKAAGICNAPYPTCYPPIAVGPGGSCKVNPCSNSICENGICCIGTGGMCNSIRPCCGGRQCIAGKCTVYSRGPGLSCDFDRDCAAGLSCVKKICCNIRGRMCSSISPCCDGLNCNNGKCQ